MDTRVTPTLVSRAIQSSFGMDVGLHKDANSFHFYSDDAATASKLARWPSTTVAVDRLSDLTVEQWVSAFGRLLRAGHPAGHA